MHHSPLGTILAKSFYGGSLRLPSIDRWALAALLATTVLLAPIASVLWIALLPEENLWPHLLRTALPGYLRNTLLLMTLVAAGTAVVGTGTAWLVARYRFPGRSLFEWALLAPLAVPAYIAAYTLVDSLNMPAPYRPPCGVPSAGTMPATTGSRRSAPSAVPRSR